MKRIPSELPKEARPDRGPGRIRAVVDEVRGWLSDQTRTEGRRRAKRQRELQVIESSQHLARLTKTGRRFGHRAVRRAEGGRHGR